ncbi:hypothetical protein ACJZ2D_000499 [Fusarium nematophilum]
MVFCTSLVKSLEARVAELETQMLAFRACPQHLPSSMASKVAQATISFGMPNSGSYFRSKVCSALFFRPSCPPLAISATVRDVEPDSLGDGQPPSKGPRAKQPEKPYTSNMIDLKSIPPLAIERMVRNYTDTHLPQYPCIPAALLADIVQRTRVDELGYHADVTTPGLDHFEHFILFIVLAISSLAMTWRDEQQARTTSESLYKSALKHLQALDDHSEIRALQISLLLAHYAHMCPERVDNWSCIANAVRIIMALGLHLEFPAGIDPDQAQQRAELFWVTYGMERSLCTNLRLPLSFPEEIITNKLQDPPPDEPSSCLISDDVRKKSSANHIYRYRALETEVHRVLYLEEDLPNINNTNIGDWIVDIGTRLEAWYRQAQTYTQYNMLEFKLRLIEDYVGQERRRRLFYPWHGVHILFEVAIIALHASWSSRDYEPLKEQAELMVQTLLPQCLRVLANIGQRWGEATRCVEKLEPLVQKVSSAFNWATHLPVFEAALIADDIESLLFSDKSLSWNQVALGEIDFGIEDGSLLFDNVLIDDLDSFQWAPEWDLMMGDIIEPNAFRGFPHFSAIHGPEQANLIIENEKLVLQNVKDFVDTNNVDCDFKYSTTFKVCLDRGCPDELAKSLATFRAAGGDTSYIKFHEGEQARAKTKVPDAVCAYEWPAASNHPCKLTQWVLSDVIQKGAKLSTHCPTVKVQKHQGPTKRWDVQTPRGVVAADTIVHCTNACAAYPLSELSGIVTPRRAQGDSYHFFSVNQLKDGTIVLGGLATRKEEDKTREWSHGRISFDDTTHNPTLMNSSITEFSMMAPEATRPGEGFSHVWTGIFGETPDAVVWRARGEPRRPMDIRWLQRTRSGAGLPRGLALIYAEARAWTTFHTNHLRSPNVPESIRDHRSKNSISITFLTKYQHASIEKILEWLLGEKATPVSICCSTPTKAVDMERNGGPGNDYHSPSEGQDRVYFGEAKSESAGEDDDD